METQIVDLCDSDSDCSENVAQSKKRRLSEDDLVDLTETETPDKKKQRSQVQRNHEDASSEPLVYVDCQRYSDSCIITSGLVKLLAELPSVVSVKISSLHHIQQTDNWSCGFRNIQMSLSALISLLPSSHSYWSQSDNTFQPGCVELPSLRQLQEHMEASWKAGFDRSGAEHYRHKIVNKQVWIGAVEVSHLLAYMGIESTVVQFMKCRESRRLLKWFCAAYFGECDDDLTSCINCANSAAATAATTTTTTTTASSGSAISSNSLLAAKRFMCYAEGRTTPRVCSSCDKARLPLYLQWKGHSVSIVGIEKDENGRCSHLLAFDPLKKGSALENVLKKRLTTPLRLQFSSLENKDCQIILLSNARLSFEDRNRCKFSVPTLTAAQTAVVRAVNR